MGLSGDHAGPCRRLAPSAFRTRPGAGRQDGPPLKKENNSETVGISLLALGAARVLARWVGG